MWLSPNIFVIWFCCRNFDSADLRKRSNTFCLKLSRYFIEHCSYSSHLLNILTFLSFALALGLVAADVM